MYKHSTVPSGMDLVRTYPHVEISSKFEALGPRNGRSMGRTQAQKFVAGDRRQNPLKINRLHKGHFFSPAVPV